MRVRSAPFRPGASPTNITRALSGPLLSLKTADRPHMPGHRVQLAAAAINSEKLAFLLVDWPGDGTFVFRRLTHRNLTHRRRARFLSQQPLNQKGGAARTEGHENRLDPPTMTAVNMVDTLQQR